MPMQIDTQFGSRDTTSRSNLASKSRLVLPPGSRIGNTDIQLWIIRDQHILYDSDIAPADIVEQSLAHRLLAAISVTESPAKTILS